MKLFINIFCIHLLLVYETFGTECIHRDYGNDGTVCVCNNDYCDEYDPITIPEKGQYVMYTSNKDGSRFNRTNGNFQERVTREIFNIFYWGEQLNINANETYQSIYGFGGAFTDSTGININSLTGKAREWLMKSYFKNTGNEYTLCRVPIGGTDFSSHPYTYDDVEGDETLKYFNLTKEDYEYKIPLIKEAYALRNGDLNFFGSAWSAPVWIKNSNSISNGFLQSKYYQLWADYYIKFLENYEKEGIHFWGLTTGNEPINGFFPINKINAMAWTPWTQSDWIKNNFGPTIRNSKYKDLKLIVLDDQRFFLPWWPKWLLKDSKTRNYIDGIAVHWYWDEFFPASLLTATHKALPEKFILATEACVGDKFYQPHVKLGSWSRGEMYARDIIEDLNNWATGWVDWNMALDTQGGPTYIENFVDSPILVNASAQEFYKQPMYYALGHFSKFIIPKSIRIKSDISTNNIRVTAMLRPDNATVVVLYNVKDNDVDLTINDDRRGSIKLTLTKRSINTIVYK